MTTPDEEAFEARVAAAFKALGDEAHAADRAVDWDALARTAAAADPAPIEPKLTSRRSRSKRRAQRPSSSERTWIWLGTAAAVIGVLVGLVMTFRLAGQSEEATSPSSTTQSGSPTTVIDVPQPPTTAISPPTSSRTPITGSDGAGFARAPLDNSQGVAEREVVVGGRRVVAPTWRCDGCGTSGSFEIALGRAYYSAQGAIALADNAPEGTEVAVSIEVDNREMVRAAVSTEHPLTFNIPVENGLHMRILLRPVQRADERTVVDVALLDGVVRSARIDNLARQISVSRGQPAVGLAGCESPECAYLHITASGMDPNTVYQVDCYGGGAQFDVGLSYLRSDPAGNINGDATCYWGYGGTEVYVTLNGINSATSTW